MIPDLRVTLHINYFLTQSTTLQARLTQQINRIRDEVRENKRSANELQLLRITALASSYESRIDVAAIASSLSLSDPVRTLDLFEKEYLIRITSEGRYIEGLHPVRSMIITDLLHDGLFNTIFESTKQSIPFIAEEDINIFLLHALINYREQHDLIIEAASRRILTKWIGINGVLKAMLWNDLYEYVHENEDLVKEVFNKFGIAWWLVLDLDVANLSENIISDVFETFKISEDIQNEVKIFRERQTSKYNIFSRTKTWFSSSHFDYIIPSTDREWADFSEVLFFSSWLDASNNHNKNIYERIYLQDTENISIPTIADLSLAIYYNNPQNYSDWIDEKNRIYLSQSLL